jgi:hypothetical protein
MSLLSLILTTILAAQTPPSDVDKLKAELEKQKSVTAELQRQLDAAKELKVEWEKLQADLQARTAAKLAELQTQLDVARIRKEQNTVPAATPRVSAPVVVTPVAPPLPVLEGKITAIANEIGLVVISLGFDDGVREGRVYPVIRDRETIATVTIDRVDAKWSAGKLVSKTAELRVGDGVRAAAVVAAKPAPVPAPATSLTGIPSSAEELRSIRKELDEVRGQVQSLTDRILPSWKDVGVTVEEASEPLCAQLQIGRGLLVRQVRDGSPAARILKGNDVIPDRTESQLMEVFRSGGTLPVRRQGKLQVFQVDSNR